MAGIASITGTIARRNHWASHLRDLHAGPGERGQHDDQRQSRLDRRQRDEHFDADGPGQGREQQQSDNQRRDGDIEHDRGITERSD